jgi:hypothetical protein
VPTDMLQGTGEAEKRTMEMRRVGEAGLLFVRSFMTGFLSLRLCVSVHAASTLSGYRDASRLLCLMWSCI